MAWWEHAYRGGGPVKVDGFPRPLGECIDGPRIGKNGYARVPSGRRGEYLYAHRVAWAQAHGPIPPGWHVHHLCGNKACVNVAHLDALPASEHYAMHRECDHADRADRPDGRTRCRTCERERRRKYERERYRIDPAYRARKKALAAAQRKRKGGDANGSRQRMVDARL